MKWTTLVRNIMEAHDAGDHVGVIKAYIELEKLPVAEQVEAHNIMGAVYAPMVVAANNYINGVTK